MPAKKNTKEAAAEEPAKEVAAAPEAAPAPEATKEGGSSTPSKAKPAKKAKSPAKKAKSPAKPKAAPKEGQTTPSKKRKAPASSDTPNKRLRPATEKRETKKIERLDTSEVAEEKPIVIKKGKGVQLESIDAIATAISERKRSDDLLRLAHRILISGRINKKTTLKANLNQFSGIVYDDADDEKKLQSKLDSLRVASLKELAAFFGVDPSGKREEISERLTKWIEKPKDTGETYSYGTVGETKNKSQKRKRSESRSKSPASKKAKKDPNAPKRPMTPYFMYANEVRAAVMKKNPNVPVTEIAQKIGAQWRALSDSEKKKFEDMAAKDKKRYEKEKAAYKPKAAKKESSKKASKKESSKSESSSEVSDSETEKPAEKSPKKSPKKAEKKSTKKTEKSPKKSPKKSTSKSTKKTKK